MADGTPLSKYSRRAYLRSGAIALSAGLAGCTLVSDQQSAPSESTETPSDSARARVSPMHFQSTYKPENAFEFQYRDLPDFIVPYQISDKNPFHPDTSNIQLTVDFDSEQVSAQLRNVATARPVTLQLWTQAGNIDADDWAMVEETELPANNDDLENLTYQDETIEFTTPTTIEPHIVNRYSLIAIDPLNISEQDTHPGRILKTKRVFSIPLGNARGSRILDGPEVNFETYRGEQVSSPTFKRNTLTSEPHANGQKAVFAIMRSPRGEYGVGTTVSQTAIASQNRAQKNWPFLINDVSKANRWEHFQTLSAGIATAHQKLGVWETIRDKLRAYKNFTAALKYQRSGGLAYHPTASLLLGEGTHCNDTSQYHGCVPQEPDARSGINCTEKTLLFTALIQNTPLNFSGDDATYIYCLFGDTPHLIAGIRTDKFDSLNDGWSQYQYSDIPVETWDAPEDISYIPVDVTSQRGFGRLSDAYSKLRVIDNLDGDYSADYDR